MTELSNEKFRRTLSHPYCFLVFTFSRTPYLSVPLPLFLSRGSAVLCLCFPSHPFVSGCQRTALSFSSPLSPLALPTSLFISPSHFLPRLTPPHTPPALIYPPRSTHPTAGPNRPIAGLISAAADAAVTRRLFILKALGGGLASAIFFVTSLRRCDIQRRVVIKRLTASL